MSPKLQLLEGKPHLVVPVVMGTVGVWHGSNGPLFYSAAELAKSAPSWNGRPVVIYHPDMSIGGGTAAQPAIFNRQKVGVLFNTRFADGKLKAECWLDVGRLQAVSPMTLDAVKAGRMMEVSTGLNLDGNDRAGTYNGKRFISETFDYKPDHLAILPTGVGACSIQDGAGLCRNSWNAQRARQTLAHFNAYGRELKQRRWYAA